MQNQSLITSHAMWQLRIKTNFGPSRKSLSFDVFQIALFRKPGALFNYGHVNIANCPNSPNNTIVAWPD